MDPSVCLRFPGLGAYRRFFAGKGVCWAETAKAKDGSRKNAICKACWEDTWRKHDRLRFVYDSFWKDYKEIFEQERFDEQART